MRVFDASRPTIEKTRMMSGVQQMLRVDWEDTRPIETEVLSRMLEAIPRELQGADAVVLTIAESRRPAKSMTIAFQAPRQPPSPERDA